MRVTKLAIFWKSVNFNLSWDRKIQNIPTILMKNSKKGKEDEIAC